MSHFYTKEGEPVFEVPKKNGKGMKKTTIREARIMGLLPSVTTIMKTMANEGLVKWMVGEAMEGRDPYADGSSAADFGTLIHECIETYLNTGVRTSLTDDEAEFNEYVHPIYDYLKGFGGTCEQILVGKDCAGTLDYFGLTNDKIPVNAAFIDWKTQRTKEGKPFAFYDSWIMQLAKYREIDGRSEYPLVNVVISSTEPGRIEYKIWDEDKANWALDSFNALSKFYWTYKNL